MMILVVKVLQPQLWLCVPWFTSPYSVANCQVKVFWFSSLIHHKVAFLAGQLFRKSCSVAHEIQMYSRISNTVHQSAYTYRWCCFCFFPDRVLPQSPYFTVMADSDLDAFFAKRDKSKKKSKFAVTPDEILAKATDERPKKEKRRKTRETSQEKPGGLGLYLTADEAKKRDEEKKEDEAWNDFEERKEADFSGLRIRKLTVGDVEEEKEPTQSDDGEESVDGDGGRGDASGPWKTPSPVPAEAAAAAAASAAPPSTPPAEVKTENTAPRKYVPPAQRRAAVAAGNPTCCRRSNKKKTTLDLQSHEDFPTLGGGSSKSAGSAWGTSNEEGRSGAAFAGSRCSSRESGGSSLRLKNKFSVLGGTK